MNRSVGGASPLADITVVDFTTALSGPACTMLLADFGASVIKVEPLGGEAARRWGSTGHGPRSDLSAAFLAMNRNKSSVALDLKSSAGLQEVRALLASADVVVENFRPGVADRLGIGYHDAVAEREDVVYCSISGFGQTGPLASNAGYDFLLQAFGGQLSVTGAPGGGSVRTGVSAIDLLAGSNAAFGIMLALRHRERTGEGQHIDVGLYDTALHLMSPYLAEYTATGEVPTPPGRFYPLITPAAVFQAEDGEVVVMMGSDLRFEQFCASVGRPELSADPRFASNSHRGKHRDQLYPALDAIFIDHPVDHWIDLCTAIGVPASRVNTVDSVIGEPHALARGMLVDTGVSNIVTAGIPITLGRSPGRVRWAAPPLGDRGAASSRTEVLGAVP